MMPVKQGLPFMALVQTPLDPKRLLNAVGLPVDHFAARNSELEELWTQFFKGYTESRPLKNYLVNRESQSAAGLEGTACLLSAAGLLVAANFELIGKLVKRLANDARSHCHPPVERQPFVRIQNGFIEFFQNDFRLEKVLNVTGLSIADLSRSPEIEPVRRVLAAACAKEVFRGLSQASRDEYVSYCLSLADAESEFIRVFHYTVYNLAFERIVYAHRYMTKAEVKHLPERESLVVSAIRRIIPNYSN